jgi:quinolinate synthase
VRALKAQHPGVPVVCYVNTSAEVKAESDACCTSANSLAVVEDMPGDKVIFLPDKFMAANLRPLTNKQIIGWDGACIVHEEFGPAEATSFRKQYPGAALLAHTECVPSVVAQADMAGSTSGMEKYIEQHPETKAFMLVTECGMSDKLQVQYPDRKFVGSCVICPYMKKVELRKILRALEDPAPEQVIELAPETISKVRRAIDRMLAVGRTERVK